MTQWLEQPPVVVENSASKSPFLLVCEHAGRYIPASFSRLGVSQQVIDEHYGWDIGALAVAQGVSQALDAELVFQPYSRLLIDCNRPLASHELIPETSENVEVAGNIGLPESARRERIEAIWQPFQQAVGAALDRRQAVAGCAILIAVHSFSPIFNGVTRPWQVCLAYNRDMRMARILFDVLNENLPGCTIAMNQPFFVTDDDDQTIPVFGEGRRIPHVLLEIRNDLLRTAQTREEWAGHIARALASRRAELTALC